MIELIIDGPITGKARPVVTRNGTFNTDKTISYENLVRWLYKEKYKDLVLEGPLSAKVEIIYSIPKSTSKKNKTAMLEGKILPTKKPDADNVLKILFDSLNNIAYKDDTQIVEIYCIKRYGEMPRVILKLEEYKKES